MTSAPHPALEFDQHQFIGAIDQGEIAHRAISVTAVVKGQVVPGSTETTDLRVAADHHVKGCTDPSDPSPQIRPTGVHVQVLITVRWIRFWTLTRGRQYWVAQEVEEGETAL